MEPPTATAASGRSAVRRASARTAARRAASRPEVSGMILQKGRAQQIGARIFGMLLSSDEPLRTATQETGGTEEAPGRQGCRLLCRSLGGEPREPGS